MQAAAQDKFKSAYQDNHDKRTAADEVPGPWRFRVTGQCR